MKTYSTKSLGDQLLHTGAVRRLNMRHHSDEDFERRSVPRFRMTDEDLAREKQQKYERSYTWAAQKFFRNLKETVIHGVRHRKLSA